MADVTSARKLSRLLHPESIAVVGGSVAEEVIKQCDAMGFAGEIWPVHPTRAEIGGRRCFATVDALPSAPDAAFLGVNRNATIELVRALSLAGAGGAVCHASGFRESAGEGPALQEELLEAAGAMPIVGPNCIGLINYLDGVPLWADQHGGIRVERGVAVISQSGNIAINASMNQRALPLAYLFSLGNQASVGVSDAVSACLDDERVTAIGLYLEGIDDVTAFDEVARRALELRKPIVALKAGASELGRTLARNHSASEAGSLEMFDAFCRRVGIGRVQSLVELIEALNLVSVVGPLKGNRLASLSASGGEAALMADAAVGRDLVYPSLDARHEAEVADTVTDLVVVSNPLDYHTFLWGDGPGSTAAYTAMLTGGYDLSILVLDWPREDRCDAQEWEVAVASWTEAVARVGAPAALLATVHDGLGESISERFHAAGIATLRGLREGLAAAAAAWEIGRAQLGDVPRPLLHIDHRPEGGGARLLDESSTKHMLASEGIPVPEDGAVTADGVADLGVRMRNDLQFGPHLVVQSGGVLAELVDDAQVLLLPADRTTVVSALGRLRTDLALRGLTGKPSGDIDALVDCIEATARLVTANADRLLELELNPLIVRPEGRGVVAGDALIRLRSS